MTFFILYYFDPITFFNLKGYWEQNKKAKEYLFVNLKSFEKLIKKFFFYLPHNEKQNKQNSILIITNYLTNLEKTTKRLKQKRQNKALKVKNNKNKTTKDSLNFLKDKQESQLLLTINFLEDFFNI
jgi:late competence protein required for DNA uptake (superfamily II DNA/RNA helicase)